MTDDTNTTHRTHWVDPYTYTKAECTNIQNDVSKTAEKSLCKPRGKYDCKPILGYTRDTSRPNN